MQSELDHLVVFGTCMIKTRSSWYYPPGSNEEKKYAAAFFTLRLPYLQLISHAFL